MSTKRNDADNQHEERHEGTHKGHNKMTDEEREQNRSENDLDNDRYAMNMDRHRPFDTGQVNYDTLNAEHRERANEVAEENKKQLEDINKHRPKVGGENAKVVGSGGVQQGGGLPTDGTKGIRGMSSGSGGNNP